MKQPVQSHEIDRLLDEALGRAMDGFDFGTATGAITDAVNAVSAQLKALAKVDYGTEKPAVIARCVAQTSKALDDFFRLLQFAKGAPDSRPDLGSDWLRGLTGEQLATVQGWLEQNQAAERK